MDCSVGSEFVFNVDRIDVCCALQMGVTSSVFSLDSLGLLLLSGSSAASSLPGSRAVLSHSSGGVGVKTADLRCGTRGPRAHCACWFMMTPVPEPLLGKGTWVL